MYIYSIWIGFNAVEDCRFFKLLNCFKHLQFVSDEKKFITEFCDDHLPRELWTRKPRRGNDEEWQNGGGEK